jgi:hypothetical protein
MRMYVQGAPEGIDWVIEVYRTTEWTRTSGWGDLLVEDTDREPGWELAAMDAREGRIIEAGRLFPGERLCLDTAMAWASKMQKQMIVNHREPWVVGRYRRKTRVGTYRVRNVETGDIILADIL